MSTHRLDCLLSPRSVGVVGASPREQSVGRKILKNLRAGGFDGAIHLVNPKYDEIDGIAAVKDVGALPQTDLLIIASPPATVPGVVAAAAAKGVGAAIVI